MKKYFKTRINQGTASDWAQKEKNMMNDAKKREAEIAKWKKRFEGMFIEIEVR